MKGFWVTGIVLLVIGIGLLVVVHQAQPTLKPGASAEEIAKHVVDVANANRFLAAGYLLAGIGGPMLLICGVVASTRRRTA